MKAQRKGFVYSVPGLCCLFLLFYFIVHPVPARCSEAPVIGGGHQMNFGEQQVLSIRNYQSDKNYTWSIENDDGQKGSLSSTTGERVTYTAPSSNPDCQNNPTIVVDCDGCQVVGTFQIAVSGWTGSAGTRAFTGVSGYIDGMVGGGCQNPWISDTACVYTSNYNCYGTWLYNVDSGECKDSTPTTPGGPYQGSSPIGICSLYYDTMEECKSECLVNWYVGIAGFSGIPGYLDQRTPEMKAAGCCRQEVLPSYTPRPVLPVGLDFGEDGCSVAGVGHPITVYNGNNTESEEDLRFPSPHRLGFFLRRVYNGQSGQSFPVGYGCP